MCLKIVQQLEPVGVGARNLSECLIIQMRNLGIDSGLSLTECTYATFRCSSV